MTTISAAVSTVQLSSPALAGPALLTLPLGASPMVVAYAAARAAAPGHLVLYDVGEFYV